MKRYNSKGSKSIAKFVKGIGGTVALTPCMKIFVLIGRKEAENRNNNEKSKKNKTDKAITNNDRTKH